LPSEKLNDLRAKALVEQMLVRGEPATPEQEAFHGRRDSLRHVRLVMNGSPIEAVALAPKGQEWEIWSGIYDDPQLLVDDILQHDGRLQCYIGAAPLKLETIRMRDVTGRSRVGDEHVVCYRYIVFDPDPLKGEEDVDTFPIVSEIIRWLVDEMGFPEPAFVTHTGRSYQIGWRIELNNDEDDHALVERVLAALHDRWPQVDTTMANPSRLIRLAGTVNRKTDQRGGLLRPVEDGTEPEIVSRELLQKVADTYQGPPPADVDPSKGTKADEGTLRDRLMNHVPEDADGPLGISMREAGEFKARRAGVTGTKFRLSDCPFHPGDGHEHGAILIQWPDGNWHFMCQGGRCKEANHHLLDLLELLDIDMEVLEDEDTGRLRWGSFSTLKAKPRERVWDKRLVKRANNIVAAYEDMGKGLLECYSVSQITNGLWVPEPELVAVVSTEDSYAEDIKPRLVAAQADLSLCLHLDPDDIGLPSGVGLFREFVKDTGVRWLWFDPLNDFMDPGLDPNKALHVSRALNPMKRLAEDSGVTNIGNMHLNRSEGLKGYQKIAHSQQFRRSCRSLLIMNEGPDDGPDEVTLVHDKGNTSRKSPALQFRREGGDLTIDGQLFEDVGRLTLIGEVEDMTTERLFLKDGDSQGRRRELQVAEKAKRSKAEMLRIRIKGEFGSNSRIPADIRHRLLDEGYDAKEIDRARKQLNITSEDDQWVKQKQG
jgi:hypothetical protein